MRFLAIATGAVTEDESQPCLKALRADGINILAIHSHMTHEQPRILFFHYWGRGRAKELAEAIKGAFLVSHPDKGQFASGELKWPA